jgi:starvation-inducible DNA-binding protein
MSIESSRPTAEALSILLANSYSLYLKTHNFHWNVTGPMFTTLHTLFETQYTELALAVDEIAERIRALGHVAPGSYRQFAELSSVADSDGVPKAPDMIRILVEDLDKVIASAKQVFESAEGTGDPASADLAVRRIDVSEKNAWMLRSHLE